MRINFKITIILICLAVIFMIWTFWTGCADFQRSIQRYNPKLSDVEQYRKSSQIDRYGLGFEEIECVINQEYSISCRKEGEEVYLPFSFLHKYFEVYGKIASYDGLEKFEWSHSYSKVYRPKAKYDPRGVFMYFEKYNVEARDRVKCLSAIEGVPISTQWESQGYYYPTQIAQFGLSHYSKNLTEPEPRRKLIEDGGKEMANWETSNTGATYNRVLQPEGDGNFILEFQTSDSLTSQVILKLDHVLDLILQVDIKLALNSSLTITLQSRDSREIFYLHYIASDLHISAQNEHTYHGLGSNRWVKITRDLVMDIQKGIIFQGKPKRKIPKSKMKVVEIALQGAGFIDNLTLSSSEHLSHFYDAAEWFVNHQDPSTGGWVNPVTRRLASGLAELEPGWCSAMGQGHGISVLARAYFHSGGDMRYLHSAVEALRPFRTPSQDGGVLAMFLGQYPWYEEYPTTPSSFVLNGFIYSLLGLYDLKTIAPPRFAKEATALYDQGMRSLKKLLPLYDMGSTSSYDLRHFTLNVAPNIARWDYHATHVNQLLLLTTIDNDPLLSNTAERWLGYMTALVDEFNNMETVNANISSSSNSEVTGERLFEEIKIPAPHGHISGKWWGPKCEQPVIALHGWQDNAGTWDELIPLLPETIAVLAIDMPGHGLSSHYPKGQFYYLFWDGVLILRRIVKHFNWKNIQILGHSLGGAIGFLYSAIFPDDVEKLMSIDIVSPTVREITFQVENSAKIIDQFLKYENLSDANIPCYSYEEMIDIVEDAYNGSITRESAKILMKRGMSPSQNNKGYHFSRDVRLKVSGLGLLPLEVVLEFAKKIKCNVLNIKGNPGMTFDRPEYYSIVLDKIKENAYVEFYEVPGTHHLHLNTPERISNIVTKFIQQPVVINHKTDESSSSKS